MWKRLLALLLALSLAWPGHCLTEVEIEMLIQAYESMKRLFEEQTIECKHLIEKSKELSEALEKENEEQRRLIEAFEKSLSDIKKNEKALKVENAVLKGLLIVSIGTIGFLVVKYTPE